MQSWYLKGLQATVLVRLCGTSQCAVSCVCQPGSAVAAAPYRSSSLHIGQLNVLRVPFDTDRCVAGMLLESLVVLRCVGNHYESAHQSTWRDEVIQEGRTCSMCLYSQIMYKRAASLLFSSRSLKELSVCQVTPKPPFTHSHDLSSICTHQHHLHTHFQAISAIYTSSVRNLSISSFLAQLNEQHRSR
jgi:hypothetical protein